MKMILATLVSCFSISAFACPTFNGTYECKGEDMEQVINVKTTVVNGVSQYALDETVVLADGVFRKVNFQGGLYDIAASCVNSSLKIDVKFDGGVGDNPDCGNEAWHLLYTLNWTPQGQNILENHSGMTVCASGKKVPSDDMKGSMVCKKR